MIRVKKRHISLDLLKVLTMMLIINSHADILYPPKVSFLASGGAIGNQLFFLISGYLFSAKEDLRNDIYRRFIKLYIPAYIMMLVTAICGRLEVNSVVQLIRDYIWPTQYWFVGAIFAYSVILYVLGRHAIEKKKNLIVFIIFIAILDMILYVLFIPGKYSWVVENAYLTVIPFRSIYSIISFVLGYYIKKNSRILNGIKGRIEIIIIAALSFVGFYAFKLLLNKGIVPMRLQIISHPLTIICALFIFLSFVRVDMNQRLEGTVLGKTINTIASLSLEAYLVQFLIIAGISSFTIAFPVNVVICFLLVLVCALALKQIDSRIIQRLSGN